MARTLGLPNLLTRVLLARGMDDPDQIRNWLKHDIEGLSDPFLFKYMAQAIERIKLALRSGETILIHGDYDVDGITSSVLLLDFFSLFQANVTAFVPRRQDGYSFTAASHEAIKKAKATLCISVDNGTNACAMIDRIQADGCDVIVTDHHGTLDKIANAHTVLNPRLPDAGYPDTDLAGVGVAFKLAMGLAESLSRDTKESEEFQSFLLDSMAYVALGTVADVAPLRGENRILVHHGLRALAGSRHPGIRALLDSANIGPRPPDERSISFRIAPLINAAGRMGHAEEAVQLLRARDFQKSQVHAKTLERYNRQRRKIERQLTARAMDEARKLDDPIVVLGGEGWHPGVLGIVASRITETLGKPAILIAFDDGIGRGSGRSNGMLDLRAALASCSSCLRSHGGHAVAVGLELDQSRFEEFRKLINELAGPHVKNHTDAQAECHAHLSELDPHVIRKFDMFGPFGPGNRRPVFLTDDLKVIGYPSIDSRDSSLRFRVAQQGIILPVRWRRAMGRFEEVREMKEQISLTYSPRLPLRGEDGPVELIAFDLQPCVATRTTP